jgi:1-aminocyclopropane-1-carboxylate deaminase/D-cysteine desulfhydrase-like pyridoxal-dependent ACC family enzyme
LGKEAFTGIQELANEILEQLKDKTTTVVLPIGTGPTAAGLRHFLPQSIRVIGIRAVKDDGIRARLHRRFPTLTKLPYLEIVKGFEGKGFGRYNTNLLDFITFAKSQYGLPLDLIYNGKAFFGLCELIEKDRIDSKGQILYLHTGGLQGNRSVAYLSN